MDGCDHIVANNLFYRRDPCKQWPHSGVADCAAVGGEGKSGHALWGTSTDRSIRSPELTIRCCVYVLVVGGEGTSRVSVLNNLFMNCDGILDTPNTTRIAGNVFSNATASPGGCWDACACPNCWPAGSGALVMNAQNGQLNGGLDLDKQKAWLGSNSADYDAAILQIKLAFNRSVTEIFADSSIEANFATLQVKTPATSPLGAENQGYYPSDRRFAWFDASLPASAGPDAESPDTIEEIFAATARLGHVQWDRNGSHSATAAGDYSCGSFDFAAMAEMP